MSKAYGIFYDQNGNVVWGTGGTSGRNHDPRQGQHLPGGTVGNYRDRTGDRTALQIQQQLTTELTEEFGPNLTATILGAGRQGTYTDQILDGNRVYFCFFQVENNLFQPNINNQVIGGSGPPEDSPFNNLIFAPSLQEIEQPNNQIELGGNWFVVAISQLKQILGDTQQVNI